MFSNKISYFFCRSLNRQIKSISQDLQNQSLTNQKEISKRNKDVVFVRHANSQFNKACQEYRLKHKIAYDWDSLCKHPGFGRAVAFNPNYIDSPLTQLGIQQCYLTSHNLDLSKIDCVLVSPHERALQTTDKILRFSKKQNRLPRKLPVIVDPLFAGSLWSSCDISKRLEYKVRQFGYFDFERVKRLSELWFIGNLRQQDKMKVYNQIKRRKLETFQDKQLLILEMINQNQVEEDAQILRNRAWQIKKELLRFKQKHCNILLISHYYVIQYLNTKSFNETDHRPVDDVDLKNCHPYYNNLQELLNYK